MKTDLTTFQPSPTASELRQMSKDQRDAILEATIEIAEKLYRDDPSLTDFEAFEADDSDGETTPSR